LEVSMFRRHLWLLAGVAAPVLFAATAYAGVVATHTSSQLPTVNLVVPNHGSVNGGTKVAIVGTNFTGATGVAFGNSESTSFSVDSDTSITALAPAGTGTVDIEVTTPNGTSQTSSADQFTYVAHQPVVSAISPSQGSVTGGTHVSIVGSNFQGLTAVDFGTQASTSFNERGGNLIVATAPPGTGTVDVTVTTSSGTSQTSIADEFTYVSHPPTVRLVTPNRGTEGGGTSVTILGGNFSHVSGVSFGGTAAESFNVNFGRQITAVSPPGAGSVDITVTTNQGTSAITPNDQFTYGFPPPSVSFILPTKGGALGGTGVTIVGSGFAGATAVNFGTTPALRFRVNSDESITASSPPGTGTVDVTVTTPQGTSSTSSADQFTYVLHPPVVRLVLPSSGSPGGGTVVTIVGANFKGVTSVQFGSTPATSFQFDSQQALTATSPAGTGTVDVTVTTPQGTSTISSADQFTYTS
jgi:hypothetical protein